MSLIFADLFVAVCVSGVFIFVSFTFNVNRPLMVLLCSTWDHFVFIFSYMICTCILILWGEMIVLWLHVAKFRKNVAYIVKIYTVIMWCNFLWLQ